jgi:hypothetical protein
MKKTVRWRDPISEMRLFETFGGRKINKEPLSHVITRSKAKIANKKDTGEGSRELVIQQPVPTRTIQEDITKMEEEVEKGKEQEVELEELSRPGTSEIRCNRAFSG